jgi:hypothetical protein
MKNKYGYLLVFALCMPAFCGCGASSQTHSRTDILKSSSGQKLVYVFLDGKFREDQKVFIGELKEQIEARGYVYKEYSDSVKWVSICIGDDIICLYGENPNGELFSYMYPR